jgi:hypothetical protein
MLNVAIIENVTKRSSVGQHGPPTKVKVEAYVMEE